MSEVLELASVAAEDLASRLTHWQVLDIVYVHAHGNLKIGKAALWRPLQQLVDEGVLKFSALRAVHPVLVPGHRFRPVLEALWRSGRVRRPEVA